jgi:hypothetical protein
MNRCQNCHLLSDGGYHSRFIGKYSLFYFKSNGKFYYREYEKVKYSDKYYYLPSELFNLIFDPSLTEEKFAKYLLLL